MPSKKSNKKPRQPRNWNAVNAQFRKAGAMKDKREKRSEEDHSDEEFRCPKSEGGLHCDHWMFGSEPCCDCGEE